MVVRGRVKNGVVVFDGGQRLPEGQQVTVLTADAAAPGTHSVLDIEPIQLGSVLLPLTSEDDLLEEMLKRPL